MGIPSTLNIPARLLVQLRKRGSLPLRSLLARLLVSPGRARRRLARRQSIYTQYQYRGLRLVTVSFRPFKDDWGRLGLLAMSMGHSRCAIFCALLEEYLAKGVGPNTSRRIVGAIWYRDHDRTLRFLLKTTKGNYLEHPG